MTVSADSLRNIKTLASLLVYLRDELDWPIETDDIEGLTFDYQAAELGLDVHAAVRIKEIKQIRPLTGNQPWGIFWINFEKKRLPVVLLRRILGHLVIKKRASASRANRRVWQLSDLLFISAYGEDSDRAITFAHFAQDAESPGDLPVLRVLGWDDGDTVLHLADAHRTLVEKLRWPDDPRDIAAWRDRWGQVFTLRHREVISTTQELVEELARLATSIRKRADTILARESELGPMRRLYAAFKTALIHDLTEDDFADVIAQTISYGLLAARFSRPAGISVQNLVDMVPPTNPFLRELLGEFLAVAGRKKGAFDFDELGIQDVVELLNRANAEAVKSDFGNRTRNEDPVIHFYEHFLAAYDKKKKVQRGVFFTPQPVVSYIVRSVHDLLITEFKLEDGLADTTTWGEMVKRNKDLKIPDGAKPGDPFVLILDPATGTATFLVEVIEVIFTHLKAKWESGAGILPVIPGHGRDARATFSNFTAYWNAYVPAALFPRLYGYELMMAPYTIAHMKLGLKLSEINARLGQPDYQFKFEGRAHIYLSNTLEPKVEQLPQIGFDALAHEAAAMNEIKWYKRFTVVIGNPPYAGISSNMSEAMQHIVDAYRVVDGAALKERKLWLQDDYVKFIRTAQTTIENAGVGMLGYITNHSYLDNPTFRGMRQSMMGTFSSIRLLDLHGNTTKKEQSPDGSEDNNVFDIKQGVAICLATRGGPESVIKHADLWGSRNSKSTWLEVHSLRNTAFETLAPDSPFYFFDPQNLDFRAEYEGGWKVTEVMPSNTTGFVTARDHFVIGFSESELLDRMSDFANGATSDAEIRSRYFAGKGSSKYDDGDSRGWKLPEARKRVQADAKWKSRVVDCLYRPFDSRKIYWCDWMIDWPRPEVTRHLLAGENFGLNVGRAGQVIDQGPWNIIFCTRSVTEFNLFRRGGNNLSPLWLYEERENYQSSLGMVGHRRLNINPAFLKELARRLGLDIAGPFGVPRGLTPEDIFHYAYAVFHSPGYRSRYAEFLKIDFPRLPLTSSLDLFRALAKLGGELVALHLMEFEMIGRAGPARRSSDRSASGPYQQLTEFIGGKNPEVEKVTYSDESVWIDKSQTEGFRGVPEPVWNFHIGGYQVCEKWLKDRKGRTLTKDDIEHYRKIVVALSETIRLMAEIDQVIEKHGGWPGAFQEKPA
ncbi:MAG: DNA methyltransferase [Verrucomicrobia bacterium]|nr:DNA methyltransferase [Verrucomicrobiota bacterium]